MMNVSFDQRPMPYEVETAALIVADRFAGVVIELENGIVLESSVG